MNELDIYGDFDTFVKKRLRELPSKEIARKIIRGFFEIENPDEGLAKKFANWLLTSNKEQEIDEVLCEIFNESHTITPEEEFMYIEQAEALIKRAEKQ